MSESEALVDDVIRRQPEPTESLRNEIRSRGAYETVRHCNGRTIPETPEYRASFRPALL